ncbi:DUF4876 domain-containing protein [Prevotella sp. kh1p2]|jgi:hypothetical protein|uniref:DUF4876 domain-containing protein n=1 Tax=Prevotella sp. kh1p2 TaxID=1761883 RepID=UPI0008B85EE7|nr:DUF4876 domain-containing protein [Prevotella sp. kh1p2]SES68679.1 Protein of unknown function [Prevotella sp. kh1p2]SNU10275.1 Protein of unknown function [Prevotellaceae bacterium KH2P17]
MKKTLLTLAALLGLAANVCAQTWNMVITRADGSTETLKTSEVKNVTFVPEDQNADQVIIKELYNGGCPLDQGTSYFQRDKGFILYNNSKETAVLSNLCVGILDPYNAEGINHWLKDGTLTYEADGYVPAINGIWYFQEPLVIEPYSQVVVSCMGAIDNTPTYSQSVNYANADYYTMYDPESGYSNTSYYPTPSEVIPTSHYLKAINIGQSNAWTLSVTSPAFFIFQTKGTTPQAFAADASNIVYAPGQSQAAYNRCLKVPVEWIIDGMEVYNSGKLEAGQKRFPADVDAGYVVLTNKLGHSLYRNVDKEATEALPENAGKLVTGYTLGVSAGDPSGIDAEASIRKGAHIVYMDNDNSSDDFHERKQFSLRDK